MLKYVIAFSVLAFCEAEPNRKGDYNFMVFTQRAPSTAVFELQLRIKNERMGRSDSKAYWKNYHLGLREADPREWFIKELTFRNKEGVALIYCLDESGVFRHFRKLEPRLEDKLLRYWPSCDFEVSEDRNWAGYYDVYGICYSSEPEPYFRLAMEIQDTRPNIGGILEQAGILPNGNEYRLKDITDAITGALGKEVRIKCLDLESSCCKKDSGNYDQQLSEVDICYDSKKNTVDCKHEVRGLCTQENIVYTSMPKLSNVKKGSNGLRRYFWF